MFINNYQFQWAPPNKSHHINAGTEIMSSSLIPLLSQLVMILEVIGNETLDKLINVLIVHPKYFHRKIHEIIKNKIYKKKIIK
jgi:hypothetical protein